MTSLSWRSRPRGRLTITLRTSEGPQAKAGPRFALADASAFHLAVTYDGTHLRAYRDGTPVGETARSGNFSTWAAQHLTFGGQGKDQQPWAGRIEGVAIWSRVLTAAEVRDDAERYAAEGGGTAGGGAGAHAGDAGEADG